MKSNPVIFNHMIQLANAVSVDAVHKYSHPHHSPHTGLFLGGNSSNSNPRPTDRPGYFYPVEGHYDIQQKKVVL